MFHFLVSRLWTVTCRLADSKSPLKLPYLPIKFFTKEPLWCCSWSFQVTMYTLLSIQMCVHVFCIHECSDCKMYSHCRTYSYCKMYSHCRTYSYCKMYSNCKIESLYDIYTVTVSCTVIAKYGHLNMYSHCKMYATL